MSSVRLRRSYDEVVSMDVACNVDLADNTGRKRLHRSQEEPDVEERVKRPLNAFMVWSQVIT